MRASRCVCSAKGEYETSRSHYLNALEINPNYADAYFNYALLLVELKDVEEAKNNLEKVTEINQNYAEAYYHKARLLSNPDDFEEARKNFETAIDIRPDFIDALYYMGKLLSGGVATDKEGVIVDSTDLPEAKDHFLKVLELKKNHPKALYNIS